MKKSIIIIINIFCVVYTTAQNPYIHHFTTSDGLPSNTVYQIFQDSKKFIWFSTDAGVVKFDGTTFKCFRKKDGLSSNDIVTIKEDSYGRIWFSNINGSLDYYFENKFFNYRNCSFLKLLNSKDFFVNFYEDSNHIIYFYNRHGEVYSLDKNFHVIKYNVGNLSGSSPINWITCLYMYIHYLNRMPSGDFKFWTSCGLFKLSNLKGENFSLIDESIGVSGVFPVNNNTTYVNSTNYGLLKYVGEYYRESIPLPFENYKIKTIIQDNDGFLWIAAFNEGVYCIKGNEIIKHFEIKNSQGIIQDNEQNIWVSTMNDGIYIINHDILFQKHFDLSNFDNQGILNLCKLENYSSIICSNGRTLFFLRKNKLQKFDPRISGVSFNLVQYNNNSLFVGEKSNQLWHYEYFAIDTTKSIKFKLNSKKIYPYKVKNFDIDNKILLTFDQSFLSISSIGNPTKNIERYYMDERINNAFFDINHKIVINATRNYTLNEGKKELLTNLSRFDGSIITGHLRINNNAEIYSIDEDSLFLRYKNSFYNLTSAFNPPLNKQIKCFDFYKSTLFFATSNNVFFCNFPFRVIKNRKLEILPFNFTLNQINDIITFNDSLYIASNEGLTIISLLSNSNNNAPPPIPYLKSIVINNGDSSYTSSEIVLIGKNKIRLSFGSIKFFTSATLFSYRLFGVDDEWTYGLDKELSVVYQNLPKGNYLFKLRMKRSNSGWSPPLEIKIIIKPTFWEYPIVWISIAALFILIIFLINLRLRSQENKKTEMNHQLILLEQKALQSMMNPHFIFNSLGSIQNYLLKNNVGDAILYLSHFSRLIRQNLKAINLAMISLDEEISRLRSYLELEQTRLEQSFEFIIDIDEELLNENVFVPSMIIQPFTENSVWHGISHLPFKGYVGIKLTLIDDKTMNVIIEDNGVGMGNTVKLKVKPDSHLNLAMNLTKKRLALISKKYHMEAQVTYSALLPTQKYCGTKVEMNLPFTHKSSVL
ncbi:MAG: histidine kinase [Bacteroidetes bacterium]|nr:histidine kinase [Bacteroidota bacterium]